MNRAIVSLHGVRAGQLTEIEPGRYAVAAQYDSLFAVYAVEVIEFVPVLVPEELEGERQLAELKRKIHVVHESLAISSLFDHFLQKREHIALVVDEYGDIQGLVTLDDILEEIVGEYTAESRAKTRDIRMLDDGNFLINGAVAIRTLNRNQDWNLPEHEASTLNGLLLEELGEIPSGKASIRIGPHIMTVVEIKDNMIGKVLVKPERAP